MKNKLPITKKEKKALKDIEKTLLKLKEELKKKIEEKENQQKHIIFKEE